MANDARLRKWFSPDKIRIMKEAVEDHRASGSRQPRSIYGKIVAEADRDLEPDEIFRRAVLYGLENEPGKTKEQQWERFHRHIHEKYSTSGYIRLWITNSPNEKKLKALRAIIEDEIQLRAIFDRLYDLMIAENK